MQENSKPELPHHASPTLSSCWGAPALGAQKPRFKPTCLNLSAAHHQLYDPEQAQPADPQFPNL